MDTFQDAFPVVRGKWTCRVCGGRWQEVFDARAIPGGRALTCAKCIARLEEREACAKIAEAMGMPVALMIADGIRARTTGASHADL